MNSYLSQARDIALLNLAGLALYRLIVKARERSRALGRAAAIRKNVWQGGNDEAAIGYEASWTGIFPGPGK